MDKRCPEYVREAYTEIESLAAKGEEGGPQIRTIYVLLYVAAFWFSLLQV